MPPNNNNCNNNNNNMNHHHHHHPQDHQNHNQPIIQPINFKGSASSSDSITCGTDRDSVMTRSPSPPYNEGDGGGGGAVIHEDDIHVVIQKLNMSSSNHDDSNDAAPQQQHQQQQQPLRSRKSMASRMAGSFKMSKQRSFIKRGGISSTLSASGGSAGGGFSVSEEGSMASSVCDDDDETKSIVSSVCGGAPDHHRQLSGEMMSSKPKKSSRRSQLLKSFTSQKSFTNRNKKNSSSSSNSSIGTNHSCHPVTSGGGGNNHLSNLLEEESTQEVRRNSDHDDCLTDMLKANGKGADASAADIFRMLSGDDDSDDRSIDPEGDLDERPRLDAHSRQSSAMSSFGDSELDDMNYMKNELDDSIEGGNNGEKNKVGKHFSFDSKALLESLGDSPTPHQLANVAAVRAKEYIEECMGTNDVLLDRSKWDKIPQYRKADLLVGQYLGKGTFSDAFEVIATVEEEDVKVTKESFGRDRDDLDKLMEKKFSSQSQRQVVRRVSVVAEDEGSELDKSEVLDDLDDNSLNREVEAMFAKKKAGAVDQSERSEDLDGMIDAMFGGGKKKAGTADQSDRSEDLDGQIDAMFGGGKKKLEAFDKSDRSEDLDGQIDAMFGGGGKDESDEDKGNNGALSADDLDKEIEAMFGSSGPPKALVPKTKACKPNRSTALPAVRPVRGNRRQSSDLGSSVCLGTQHRLARKPKQHRKVVLAMKCLRPQIRSDAEQFMIGVEDLVHETAMLASLDHPNIVKLHGRAGGGCISSSFRLCDGYFILLDRLKDTLDERIQRWKKSVDYKRSPPGLSQIKTAVSLADAMSYLHSKRIVFRDLKPANVGFDSAGVLKLFDFGFAIGVEEEYTKSLGSNHSFNFDDDDSDNEDAERDEESHLLYDKCGTPRYMAPEVGLEMGYSLPADVYSFGILLWEMCALKKPFGHVKSAAEFHKSVFEKGARPKLGKCWPPVLREIMTECWSSFPGERPEMSRVKSLLAAHARDVMMRKSSEGSKSLRQSLTFRRFTG